MRKGFLFDSQDFAKCPYAAYQEVPVHGFSYVLSQDYSRQSECQMYVGEPNE
jgi:hypothetical protein